MFPCSFRFPTDPAGHVACAAFSFEAVASDPRFFLHPGQRTPHERLADEQADLPPVLFVPAPSSPGRPEHADVSVAPVPAGLPFPQRPEISSLFFAPRDATGFRFAAAHAASRVGEIGTTFAVSPSHPVAIPRRAGQYCGIPRSLRQKREFPFRPDIGSELLPLSDRSREEENSPSAPSLWIPDSEDSSRVACTFHAQTTCNT